MNFLSGQPWVERLGWTLVHFLWQGALIAALYAVARRWVGQARSAQVRYLLACAALAAMVAAPIVTFGLSVSPDSSSVSRPAALVSSVSAFASNGPVSPARLPGVASRVWRDDVMPWLVVAWFAGAILCWARLVGGWVVCARMRSMLVRPAPVEWQRTLDGLRTRIRVSRPVRLLVSALVQVPTVMGWLRPVVLVPLGALSGLHPEHVEALLAHELAHIRRHDYLVNVLQGIAEALLFYHPAVWWISGHIRNERELCCDDVAVAISGDVLTYASALADLESCRPAHFTPATLAANGGSVGERIARLLGVLRPVSNPRPGPSVIATATIILFALFTAFATFAQPTASRAAFEVASIRPVPASHESGNGNDLMQRLPAEASHGSLIMRNVSLSSCLQWAYGVKDYQISGPVWMNEQRYDISAKTEDTVPDSQLRPMLQTLLADRFKLSLHRSSKDLSEFALVVATGGPKMHPAEDDRPSSLWGVGLTVNGQNTSMDEFANSLTGPLGRPVVDRTELNGRFDFNLDLKGFIPEAGGAKDGSPRPEVDYVGILMSALPGQLGLKLEATKGPVEILVIDHVEKPSEN